MKATCNRLALKILRLVYTARYTDEKMAILSRQNKGGTFQLSAAGHELIGVVSGQMLIPGKDWCFPYYRDQPFAISIGCDLKELFGAFLGRATLNHSGGRMMPHHFSHKKLRIFCQSSVVGSQFLHAVGRGLGIKNLNKDEVVYVSAGDGATSQGDFHEALNFAALYSLPIIFMIQSNGWAISVPISEQTAGSSIANVARGYQGIDVYEVDGTSYTQIQRVLEPAIVKARSGFGPSVIIADVPRLAAHSNSDDPKKYKTEEVVSTDQERDPILSLQRDLLQEGVITEKDLELLKQTIRNEIDALALEAENIPYPEIGSSQKNVFAESTLPFPLTENPLKEGEKVVIMDALNHALDEEMQHDPNVIVFGQDVAGGKGGVFGITKNLTAKYGKKRCFNTPLAESTIIGLSIGLAADGLHKPIAEIQFADYLWTGINQLFNEAASIHYRSDGQWEVPIVVRMPYGGYIQGGPYHSQSIEAFLAHCPGLKVVIPSNASDAKGLLKTAIRDPNPVLFLEHKALYRQQKFCARVEPSKDYFLAFGQASVIREGSDVTLVAWGMMVLYAFEAAEKLALQGISVEVIDARTIVPFDTATVLSSVQKTGKLLIVHEAPRSGGFGAEIAARVAEEAFPYLDAPIMRIGGFESVVPYSKPLENEVLPQPSDIEKALLKLVKY